MAKQFRFMGRDPVSKHVVKVAGVHVVPAREQAALCGVPWEQAVSEGWITRQELKAANFPPEILRCCQDVIWGIRKENR